MNVHLKLFAAVRAEVGSAELLVELEEGSRICDLRDYLCSVYPQLEALLRSSFFAIEGQYASDTAKLRAGEQVACIPPVSGG